MFPSDLLTDLPEPRDDEPSSLRDDIADELADHLQCAYRREALKDGDSAAAQRRALDRFGDPKTVARRLWWQTMRSRIMKQRIVSGLQWLVAVTAMLISGTVLWQQSQLLAELRQGRQEDAAQRQALTAKLDQLQPAVPTLGPPIVPPPDQVSARTYGPPPPDQLSAQAYDPARFLSVPEGSDFDINVLSSNSQMPIGPKPPLPDATRENFAEHESPSPAEEAPPLLTLNFIQDTEVGELVSAASVTMTNSSGVKYLGLAKEILVPVTADAPYGGTPGAVREATVKKTWFFRRSLEPDLYQLRVVLADGQASERLLSIRDDKPRELTIRCPAPRKKTPVSVSISPLPEKLQRKNFRAHVDVSAGPVEIDRVKWTAENLPYQRIVFDVASGLPVAINAASNYLELKDLPAEERQVFLPIGAVSYRIEMSQRPVVDGGVPVYEWPRSSEGEYTISHTIKAEQRDWKIELPKEYLESVQRDIDMADSAPALRAQ